MSKFNAEEVIHHFEKACVDESDVNLLEYIAAYQEINKLFLLFGKIFGFVESDVREKEQILQSCNREDPKHYATVKAMTTWEINDSANPVKQGSRTLLRLHRALLFLKEFLVRLRDSPSNAQLPTMCRASYEVTLAKYHPWLIRKGVALASCTLGSRETFIRAVAGCDGNNNPDEEQINSTINRLITTASEIYERVQHIYEEGNILNLP